MREREELFSSEALDYKAAVSQLPEVLFPTTWKEFNGE